MSTSIMHFATIRFEYLRFYLILVKWNLFEAQSIQQDQGTFLQLIMEKELSLKPSFSGLKSTSYSSDRNGCVSHCSTYSSCKSANFRISTGECLLFGVNSWEDEFTIVSDIDSIVVQKIAEMVVTHGEWTLVFRGLANVGKSVYDAFSDTSLGHDQPLSPLYPIGCLRLDTNLSCDHHFRSNILNEWSNLTITEVKFGIYKDGVMQHFILFNGSSSTFLDWFSYAKLINTSWTDLTTNPIDYFDIFGIVTSQSKRRFYIEHSHPFCPIDSGWFACIDQVGDSCVWAQPVPTFPRLLYAHGSNRVANSNMTTADVMAVFIKF